MKIKCVLAEVPVVYFDQLCDGDLFSWPGGARENVFMVFRVDGVDHELRPLRNGYQKVAESSCRMYLSLEEGVIYGVTSNHKVIPLDGTLTVSTKAWKR